jgi:hypothetical protein
VACVPSTSNTTTMCDDGPPPTTTTTHQGQVEATVGGGLQERGTSMSKSWSSSVHYHRRHSTFVVF